MGGDRVKAAAALRGFLASAPGHVAFIGDRLAREAPDRGLRAKVRKLLEGLDADEFDARDRATDELVKLGAPAAEALRALAAAPPSEEAGYRARLILRKLGDVGTPGAADRLARAVRILERAGNREARDLLARMVEGAFGSGAAPDAKAALARMAGRP
jgi:hypothetical protein